MPDPILIELDVPRQVRWTERAKVRIASLPRPVGFADLGRGRRAKPALCAILWAALVDRTRDHGFEEPEDLAEYFVTPEQQVAALKVVNALIEEAFPKKEAPPTESSTPGPGASSSSDSGRPTSTPKRSLRDKAPR